MFITYLRRELRRRARQASEPPPLLSRTPPRGDCSVL
jgi:hypothetical protein